MKIIETGSSYSKGLSDTNEGYIKFDELSVSTTGEISPSLSIGQGGFNKQYGFWFFYRKGKESLNLFNGIFWGKF